MGYLRRAGDFDLRHRVDPGFAGRLERFERRVEAAAARPVEPHGLERLLAFDPGDSHGRGAR